MTRIFLCTAALACALGASAAADELPPGLVAAELLPGWVAADGTRITALRLDLAPGWKTYWRSPGDTGIPPHFDWAASDNLAAAEPLWPRPEVILSGGERTLGYHDELVLPIQLTPRDKGQPVTARVSVDFGLCRDICVPAHVELQAPAPQGEDPRIDAALAQTPEPGEDVARCTMTDIADGVQVAVRIGEPEMPGDTAALELAQDGVWVSQPVLTRDARGLTATADFVAPSGKPFPLDPAAVRLTLIAPEGAVEYQGCAPA